MDGPRLARPDVVLEERQGAIYLRAREPLGPVPRSLGALLRRAAARAPGRTAFAEPAGEGLREVSWAGALAAAEGVASALIGEGLDRRPILVLSGNSVDHALLLLGASLAGVPLAPVSAAYSLRSQDFAQLREVVRRLDPGLVFVEPRAPFERALAALGLDVPVWEGGPAAGDHPSAFRPRLETPRHPGLADREAAVGPDTVAKILFTSGSTGVPKGVPNTHGMVCADQQAIAQVWPFLEDTPPVLVDWLPWSHTFGGNHDFNLVLFHAGTLVVDDGKPLPELVDRTVANLRRTSPTIHFNVPAGFAALVPRLEADAALRERFFARLEVVFYAGAALPDDLWQRLLALSRATTGREVFLTTAWGSTETSPLVTSAHFRQAHAGNVGVPVPGAELKLVPAGPKLEVRVRGPMVFGGYLGDPALTEAAFDEEGFYRIGDALRLADPADPSAGLLFDGRVAEDFKLATGTWVHVGALRTKLLAACSPALLDLVVAGHDGDAVGVLAWPSPGGCRALGVEVSEPAALAAHPVVREHVEAALRRWNAEHPAATQRVARALLLAAPPDIDAGEITDKGYVNQRATLARRAADVARLWAEGAEGGALLCPPTSALR